MSAVCSLLLVVGDDIGHEIDFEEMAPARGRVA